MQEEFDLLGSKLFVAFAAKKQQHSPANPTSDTSWLQLNKMESTETLRPAGFHLLFFSN